MLNVLIYTHNTRGLGHASRAVAIASLLSSLKIRPNVICVGGVDLGATGWLPQFIEHVKLPSYAVVNTPDGYTIGSINLNIPKSQLVKMRTVLISSLIAEFNPHLIVVDLLPKGKQNELHETLVNWKNLNPTRNKLCYSLRGIIGTKEYALEKVLDYEALEFLDKYYDVVWVFSDEKIINVTDAYALSQNISSKVRYLGYLTRFHDHVMLSRNTARINLNISESLKVIALTLGSGWGAESMLDIAIEAIQNVSKSIPLKCKILLGPKLNMYKLDWLKDIIKSDNIFLTPEYVSNPLDVYRAVDLVISRGGYNTLAEIMLTDTPLIVIPRPDEENEQELHANKLANNGYLEMIIEGKITTEKLEEMIREQLLNAKMADEGRDLNYCTSEIIKNEIDRLGLNYEDDVDWRELLK